MTLNTALECALACQAVGDALGDKFEFDRDIPVEEVIAHIASNSKIEITDDTQMAYFSLRALHRVLDMGGEASKGVWKGIIMEEYLAWYSTQVYCRKTRADIPDVLYKRQSPGMACMSSLGKLSGSKKRVRPPNEAKGCGSVMRIAPFFADTLGHDQAVLSALVSASVTHDHEDNVAAILLYGKFAEGCLNYGKDVKKLAKFTSMYRDTHDISELGSGFYALEAVNMAMYACLKAKTYEQLLTMSICHDGDSDSVAAIAGALWGMMTREMPPVRLLKRVVEWPDLLPEIIQVDALTNRSIVDKV